MPASLLKASWLFFKYWHAFTDLNFLGGQVLFRGKKWCSPRKAPGKHQGLLADIFSPRYLQSNEISWLCFLISYTFPEGNRQILVFLSPFKSYSVFTYHTPLIETKKLHRSKTRFICWSNFLSVCAEVYDMVCFARSLTINSICTSLWFFSFQSYAGWTSLSPWSLRARLKSEATETNCFSDSSLRVVDHSNPMSDQDRISLYDINTTPSRQVTRVKENMNCRILSWSNTKFSELRSELCGGQWGKLAMGCWKWRIKPPFPCCFKNNMLKQEMLAEVMQRQKEALTVTIKWNHLSLFDDRAKDLQYF